MAITYAILGASRLNNTRLGYHSGTMLIQVGRRLSVARLGYAKLGATRLNQSILYDNLRCIEPASLKISQKQGDLPSLTMALKTDYAERPAAGMAVVVGIGTLKNRLFLGRVGALTEPEKAGWTTYDLDCDSVAKDLVGIKVFETYETTYARDILQDLFDTYTTGYLWKGSNAQGAYFSSYEFRGESLFDICVKLAELSYVQFGVNPRKHIYFAAPRVRNIADLANPPRYELNLNLKEDCKEFISQVIVLYSGVDTLTQNWKGDGVLKEFKMSLPAQSVTQILVNGISKSWGVRNKDDNSNNDFSVDLQNGAVYTSKHPTLTASDTLTIIYMGKVNARVKVTDNAAVRAWATLTGTTGIVTRVEDARDIISEDEAIDVARNLLEEYARVYYSGTYQVRKQVFALPDLRLGDIQTITARSRNVSLQIQGIDMSVYIPGDGARLFLQYDVNLGERVYQIEEDIKRARQAKVSDQLVSEVNV